MEKNKVGRPTDLTEENKALIEQCIGAGLTQKDACEIIGVTEKTFCNWKNSEDEEFIQFFQHLKRISIQAKLDRLERIKKAGEAGTWVADMTWLERRYPREWGRLDKLAFTDPEGKKEAKIIYLPEEETNGKLETATRETD